MAIEKDTLNMAAPVLCTIGSFVALLAAVFSRGKNRSAVMSALFGTIGSAAWAMSSLQDAQERRDEVATTG
jgi:hypothetical protein